MTIRQKRRALGDDNYLRLQYWHKYGSLVMRNFWNGHGVYVKKIRPGFYEMYVDGELKGVAKGQQNARILVTKFADI